MSKLRTLRGGDDLGLCMWAQLQESIEKEDLTIEIRELIEARDWSDG